jgi:tetratricopeptide (TPR) repeat protein
MRSLHAALMGSLLAALASPALADQRSDAREHFMQGTKYFDLGRFDEAIKEYEAAFEIKDEPAILYNIAQAHRLANHAREAVHFYKAYLRRAPTAKNRDEVETKIEELEKLLEQQQRTQTLSPDNPMMPGERVAVAKPQPKPVETKPAEHKPATTTPPAETKPETAPAQTGPETPPATPPPGETKPVSDIPTPAPAVKKEEPTPGKTKKIAGLTLVGVGAVALIGGIVCSALATSAANEVSNEAMAGQPFDPSKESAGKTDQLVAGVMYGVGGAILVAGAVVTALGFVDAKKASHAMIIPAVSPTQAGVTVQLSF